MLWIEGARPAASADRAYAAAGDRSCSAAVFIGCLPKVPRRLSHRAEGDTGSRPDAAALLPTNTRPDPSRAAGSHYP
ncbi:hypothetical protein Cme02nite_35710 [Catellatospora methionotrophica]|uniref:Uncharacterized protein n=1 Tax=Catellatospora methionotrophica TaxID=121620 RepID=A0A8J3LBC6_9ACTN|nr:hypothetical protein Cme02nite_35710 [Catellatospora methionotrophica]